MAKPPPAVTGVVSWRSDGIKYRKNEIFLDVVESVNILVGSNGSILRSEILGALKMRSYLSGMPELKLGLNDKLLFEAQSRSTGKGKVACTLSHLSSWCPCALRMVDVQGCIWVASKQGSVRAGGCVPCAGRCAASKPKP